jgi:hypothetical protein
MLSLCILELHGVAVACLQYDIRQYNVLPFVIEVEESPPILNVESLMFCLSGVPVLLRLYYLKLCWSGLRHGAL